MKVAVINTRYCFFCPACDTIHELDEKWQFNQDCEKPTFYPSIKVSWKQWDSDFKTHVQKICHSYVTDGKIRYLSDCTHSKAGQTVELPELKEKDLL